MSILVDHVSRRRTTPSRPWTIRCTLMAREGSPSKSTSRTPTNAVGSFSYSVFGSPVTRSSPGMLSTRRPVSLP